MTRLDKFENKVQRCQLEQNRERSRKRGITAQRSIFGTLRSFAADACKLRACCSRRTRKQLRARGSIGRYVDEQKTRVVSTRRHGANRRGCSSRQFGGELNVMSTSDEFRYKHGRHPCARTLLHVILKIMQRRLRFLRPPCRKYRDMKCTN